ncbi:MAG: TIGR02302 family protein [Geminicoccaceae bacterium]|nr:TIGR02302 family protein [Geminicoccaceae bacterium]
MSRSVGAGVRRLGLRLFGARLFETVERLWPAVFPAVVVLVLFAILAFVDFWGHVPVWVHWIGLGIFGLVLVGALGSGLRRLRPVTRGEAIRRLERDSELSHEPLGSLEDRLGTGEHDPLTRRLWERQRERALRQAGRLRLGPPRSPMPRLDPWALRAILGLVLLVSLVEARGEWWPRLVQAVVPGERVNVVPAEVAIRLWITPPAYTGTAPFGEERTARSDTLSVPAGSELLLQVHGLPDRQEATPSISLAGQPVDVEWLGADRSGAASAQVRTVLDAGGELAVHVGHGEDALLRSWNIEVVPDEPPAVSFAEELVASQRATLEIRFDASDDYGLMRLELAFAPADRPDAMEVRELLAPSGAPRELATGVHVDLSAHPLAGLPVRMRLRAVDAIDQVGESREIEMVLPERKFVHPLARAIIAIRKEIVREPENVSMSAAKLDALARTGPAEDFGVAVPLTLLAASSRLTRPGPDGERVQSVVAMLWDLALFIEDGRLSLAEKELRALQEELQRALLEGADSAELEQLMDRLQEAMERYMQEMMRNSVEQAQRMPEGMPVQPIDPSQMITPQDLQSMMDRARELMRNGAREQAQELLSQLQRMMENMQTALQPMQPGPGEQAMGDLQRMIELQQELLDRSFQMQNRQDGQPQAGESETRPGQQGQPGEQDAGRSAGEQEALRRALGELMRRMGEMGMDIPRSLGQAEMQMRGARDALQRGEAGQAIGPQGQAVDLMQQGGQAMMQQLREMMAQQGMQPGRAQQQGRDPLGRSTRNDGGFSPEGTKLPAENDLGRARGVLEELYRRSRDRQRPPVELDYYDRLLDRF